MTPTRSTAQQRRLEELACVHPNPAGLDIGSEEIVAAVPPDRDSAPVRVYRTFTPDLQTLLEWLLACRIETVVMESTGVFWIPVYELLEQHGITPYLVNAGTSRPCLAANPTGTMPSGSRSFTRSVCFKDHFGPMLSYGHSARSPAIVLNSFAIARRISCICSRRSR
jgi:hypothetical protein